MASDSLYFARTYAQINQNIEEGRAEDNLARIDALVRERIFQELDCYQKGKIFHRLGVSYYLVNREEDAIRFFRDSVLSVWKNCPAAPATEKAGTIFNIGVSFQYLGQPDKAKPYIDESLSIFENDPAYPPVDLAKRFELTGNFYRDNHDSFRAELYYENALKIYAHLPGTEDRKFKILNNLLIMSLDFKAYDKAQNYFRRALDLYRTAPRAIDDLQLSMIYQNAGIADWESGDLAKALEKNASALRLINRKTDPLYYANAVELTAMIKGGERRYEEAVSLLREVADIRRANLSNLESYMHLATAYENMCDIHLQKGDLKQAEVFLAKAFEALMINGAYDDDNVPIVSQSTVIDDLHLIRLLALKNRIHKQEFAQQNQVAILEEALTLPFKIDTIINNRLFALQFEGSKLQFLQSVLTHYGSAIEDALDLFSRTGKRQYLRTAYYFSAKTKAIILQNELNNSDAFEAVASPALIERENQLVQRVYAIQLQLSKDNADADSLSRQYLQAQRELEAFIRNMEEREPAYYRKKYAFIKPPVLDAIQASLPADLAVVEYFYRSDKINSFWITRDSFYQETIANDPAFVQEISAYVAQCHDPKLKLSAALGRSIFGRLLEQGLAGAGKRISRLCVIPDGELHTLSFEALNCSAGEPPRYLIQDYSVFYSYSVSLLFRKGERSNNGRYVGFGAGYSPELSRKLRARRLLLGENNLGQLNLARREINSAAAIFAGEQYLDGEASLENFYRYSSDAEIVHLSLHGLVDVDDPLRSCIIFDDGAPDFVLSAADLYAHRINADLVVLSACQSANGKIYRGEGVQGMSKAFMLSGAQNIVSSLWNASEAASLRIITAFLQYVRDGRPNDLALRQAKLDFLAAVEPSQRHPHYWANFILIGELDQDEKPARFLTGTSVLLALAALLTLGGLFFLIRFRRMRRLP